MLVLGRKAGERVRVIFPGHDGKPQTMVLTVVKVQGDRVRVGFEGPAAIRVERDELAPRSEGGVA